MRLPSCMNDYKEIQHGRDMLFLTYGSNGVKGCDAAESFKAKLNEFFPNITLDIEALFNHWHHELINNTYLLCVSEHYARENENGRLSMWRAYGGNNSVALVMNGEVFFNESDALKAYTLPVEYMDKDEFEERFSNLVQRLNQEEELIKAQSRESIVSWVFQVFRWLVLSTKHPGFSEEKEWRVVYSPGMQKSEYVLEEIESIAGVPQPVCKIKLKDIPNENLTGIEIPALLNRIIIGPVQFSYAMWCAFVTVLDTFNIAEPWTKVTSTQIPLRRI